MLMLDPPLEYIPPLYYVAVTLEGSALAWFTFSTLNYFDKRSKDY